MKKILITTAIIGSLSALSAQAQSYDPNYPSQVSSPNYYNYGANYGTQPARKAPQAAFKKFSIGMDYVLGSPSITSKEFSIKSPLTGGQDYVGNTDKFDDNIDAINVNIGVRPFRYLGFEAFYQQSLSDNQVKYTESYSSDPRFAQADYDLKYAAYGLDAIVYLPLAPWFEILGSVGVANYDFTAEANFSSYNTSTNNKVKSNTINYDESKVGYRYGAGAQVWLSQRLAFRAMYRYASIGGEFFDDISEIALGLRYNF